MTNITRKKKNVVKGILITLMTAGALQGCSIPVDETIVRGDFEGTGTYVKMLIPSWREHEGDFIDATVVPYYALKNKFQYDFEILSNEPPFYISKDWKEKEKLWSREFAESEKPELVLVNWDNTSIDKESLAMLESVGDFETTIPQSLNNEYAVPIGVYADNLMIRRSELYRVMGEEERQAAESQSALQVLDVYFSKENANRNMYIDHLYDLASSESPMAFPTVGRIHHKRLKAVDITENVKKAVALKKKWKINLIDDEANMGVVEGYTHTGLNQNESGDFHEREIYILRPSCNDPTPYGIASSKGNENTYQTKAFIEDITVKNTQVALYVMSSNDRYGELFCPVDPNLFDALVLADGSGEDFGVDSTREFYKTWLSAGRWEPAIYYEAESYEIYDRLEREIYKAIEDESGDWSEFEIRIEAVLNGQSVNLLN